MDKLLAKSPKLLDDRRIVEITLLEHTQHVVNAAKSLFGDERPTRLGERWLEFFGIPDQWGAFRQNLIAACAFHDWGKANDGFQGSLRKRGEQIIRHEHFSALLLGQTNVRQALVEQGYDFPLVVSAVLTHHLKAGSRADGFAMQLCGKQNGIVRLVDFGSQFQELVEYTASELGLPKFDLTRFPERWSFGKPPTDIREHRKNLQDQVLCPFDKQLRTDEPRRRLLFAVRAALIAADAAGSGLVREGHSLTEWISENVTKRKSLTFDQIFSKIICPRVDHLSRQNKWQDKYDGRGGFTDFQIACDTLPDRALLLAPCGSGKTLAAWRWIAGQLRNRPAGHALFLYPTRATAREGFKDYVSWAPEADAALMHGTSGFDLEGMFENPAEGDDRSTRDYESKRRLFSLGYWSKRAFSATVDQFLAFMQYGYGPVCMLPVLADSVIVIDEVHSFDRNMFSALKDFLKSFNVPVICMTATLRKDRWDDLVNGCGLTPPQEWPKDLQQIAELPRYRLRVVAGQSDAELRVREALQAGKRVLWVVNQVKRAHEILQVFVPNIDFDSNATELHTAEGIPVVCYHSRFKLSDRVERHEVTMKYLKPSHKSAALGITTQVCEMSLDIDVDLLVTEECPVTSLIQRMGRCNRQTQARSLSESGEIIVYPPVGGDSNPYNANDLAGLPEFLQNVNGRDLSQADLEVTLQAVPCPQPTGDPLSRFLTSGAYAVGPKEDDGEGFREGNDFNQQCVLLKDLADYRAVGTETQPGFILPIPKGKVLRGIEWDEKYRGLKNYLGLAPDAHYHPAIGFCDKPLTAWGTM